MSSIERFGEFVVPLNLLGKRSKGKVPGDLERDISRRIRSGRKWDQCLESRETEKTGKPMTFWAASYAIEIKDPDVESRGKKVIWREIRERTQGTGRTGWEYIRFESQKKLEKENALFTQRYKGKK